VDRYKNCRKEDALPIVLSLDCILKRDIAKDALISYRDVELPSGRLCDTLRAEQTVHFEPIWRAGAT
jgi:predicted homoserine dehydrogenase-like protein